MNNSYATYDLPWDDCSRIASEIIELLAENMATYRNAELIAEIFLDRMKGQKVQSSID